MGINSNQIQINHSILKDIGELDTFNGQWPLLKNKIEFLEMQEQPEQKTKEWYQFRYNLITASNLWKVFGTDSQVNSLIYEKCKPFEEIGGDGLQSGPLFWGIK